MAQPIVYVVDDDQGLRDSVCLLLQSNGLAAVAFPSGDAFLNARSADQAGCLVLDLRMPGMGGLEVQQALIDRGDTLPVVVVSGHGDIRSSVKAMKAGAVDFIEKPYAEEDLMNAVGAAIDQDARDRSMAQLSSSALAAVEKLTPREAEVFAMLAAGHPTKTIANRLDISVRTAEVHRGRVMEKVGARNIAEVVRLALAAGIDIDF